LVKSIQDDKYWRDGGNSARIFDGRFDKVNIAEQLNGEFFYHI